MKIKNITSESIYFSIFHAMTLIGIGLLILTLILLLLSGYSVIDQDFLTRNWQHRDITQGGIFPAILGSLYLGLGVIVISFPLGISTAIFLTEYSKNNLLNRIIQLAIRNLSGVPSVVYGLFGLVVFVNILSFGSSLLSGVLTLSLMTIPWIITASVESFQSVPQKFREASLALGATQWQTIRKVVLPSAITGCITGGIIGVARALGETAPLIMVGATFYLSKLPSSPLDKFMALPYHTFILATQHSSPYANSYAAGTAFVLIMLTFLLSLGAIILRFHFRSKKDW
ncbi:MAG: phosphate ABC transporter permease PstA [Candidatus Paceibacterota bacterium]|jgi:phosphate transport system permease protein